MTTLEPQRSLLRAAAGCRRLTERSTRAKETLRRIEELAAFSLFVLAVLALAGCTSVARHPAPPTTSRAVRPAGLPAEVRSLGLDASRLATAGETVARLRRAASDGTVDILALSGGGAGGTFGSGAVIGWTARGDRPQFEVVTGVSAGALIAPFAFLGSAWDARLAAAISPERTSVLLRHRTIDLLFRPSIYRGDPLAEFVRSGFPDSMIDEVGRASAGGRMLFVATTDLDRGATVIWDLGAIARQNNDAGRSLFRKVLVASSSIPGIFPPVMIGVESEDGTFDEMHADGGVTVAFFVAPEIALIVPGALGDLAGANLYVLMNAQNAGIPQTTPGRIGPILERSAATALNQLSRTQLQLTSAFAAERGMTFRVTEIPLDYPYQGSVAFRPENTRALYEYGERCAARGLLWTTLPGALTRANAAMDRLASRPDPKALVPAAEVPCPAETRP